MINQEAREVLEDLWKYEHSKYSEQEIRDALDMGIKALEKENNERNENSDEQQVLLNVILPSLQGEDEATLFNKVSIILYETYSRPMGAPLCAVIAYVIKELKRRESEDE